MGNEMDPQKNDQKPLKFEKPMAAQKAPHGLQPSPARPRPKWTLLGLGLGFLLIGLGFTLTHQKAPSSAPNQAENLPSPTETTPVLPVQAASNADPEALSCARILPQMAHLWKMRNPTARGYPALSTLMVGAWKTANHPCNNNNLTFTGAATQGPYTYTIKHALGKKTFEVTPENIRQDGRFLEKTTGEVPSAEQMTQVMDRLALECGKSLIRAHQIWKLQNPTAKQSPQYQTLQLGDEYYQIVLCFHPDVRIQEAYQSGNMRLEVWAPEGSKRYTVTSTTIRSGFNTVYQMPEHEGERLARQLDPSAEEKQAAETFTRNCAGLLHKTALQWQTLDSNGQGYPHLALLASTPEGMSCLSYHLSITSKVGADTPFEYTLKHEALDFKLLVTPQSVQQVKQTSPKVSSPVTIQSTPDQEALKCAKMLPTIVRWWRIQNFDVADYPEAVQLLLAAQYPAQSHPEFSACNGEDIVLQGKGNMPGDYLYSVHHAQGHRTFEVRPQGVFEGQQKLAHANGPSPDHQTILQLIDAMSLECAKALQRAAHALKLRHPEQGFPSMSQAYNSHLWTGACGTTRALFSGQDQPSPTLHVQVNDPRSPTLFFVMGREIEVAGKTIYTMPEHEADALGMGIAATEADLKVADQRAFRCAQLLQEGLKMERDKKDLQLDFPLLLTGVPDGVRQCIHYKLSIYEVTSDVFRVFHEGSKHAYRVSSEEIQEQTR